MTVPGKPDHRGSSCHRLMVRSFRWEGRIDRGNLMDMALVEPFLDCVAT